MIGLGIVVGGCLVLGLLFSLAGQLLMLGLGETLPFGVSVKHASWLAIGVLVAAKALKVIGG